MGRPDADQKSPIHPSAGMPPAAGIPMAYTEMPSAPAQQPSYQLRPESTGQWSVGVFDCCSDCGTCCLSCCCPMIAFGRISEIIDRGRSSCGGNGWRYYLICVATGCACIYSCIYRQKMRKQYNLEGSCCTDCLVHCCCEACALTQEYRELQNRGFDVAMGWHWNVERNRGVAMQSQIPPVVEGGMKR